MNMISNTSFCLSSVFTALTASVLNTCAPSRSFVKSRFLFIHSRAFLPFSTNTALFAPLLSASMPIAPLPLNRSRKLHPGISGERTLNKVSFILSVVGLVSIESTVTSFKLRARPAITLIIFS